MTAILTSLFALCFFGTAVFFLRKDQALSAFSRLLKLSENEDTVQDKQIQSEIDWANSQSALTSVTDKLGKAGFFTEAERKHVAFGKIFLFVGCTVVGVGLGVREGSPMAVLFGAGGGLYVGLLAWQIFLRSRAKDFQREIMFQLPLSLEALILLVEAGLGILPAIEKMVSVRDSVGKPNPVIRFFRLTYELSSHGMPFSQALELVSDAADLKVLRHVLLHLDISGSEGGELVPSLRALSDYTHTEWKLSVETRVKRLENLVVFPVFASVLGLMLLTIAVPIVPVLKFREMLDEKRGSSSPLGSAPAFSSNASSNVR